MDGMRITIRLLAFAAALLTYAGQAQHLAVAHVTVIDVESGRARPDMTVVADGPRISAVTPATGAKVPPGSRIVDGRGKFLIPGLWDMHVHMFGELPPTAEDQSARTYFAPAFLAHGITGVRSMFDDLGAIRKLREEIPGFDVVTAGPVLDGDPPYFRGFIGCKTPEDARRAVQAVKRDGGDFVKVYSLLSREAFFAIADESSKAGLRFAGHLPNSVTAAEASDAGQLSFEHLMGIPNDPALFARFVKNGTWQTPTLVALRAPAFAGDPAFENDSRVSGVPEPIRQYWKMQLADMANWGKDAADRRSKFEQQLRTVAAMQRAGVKILAGSDTPNPYVFPGISLHEELALLVTAGLTTAEALGAATVRPAEFLGRLDHAGSIVPGKDADLVLLDGDPLADIKNTRRISAVILKGKVR
jgi:imidazolonepropionase-like amidohydrolase